MGTYVTPTGLKRKTLQEVRLELETMFKQVFGPEFETSVDSPNGVLISQLALAQSNLWELALEVFNSHDPNQATGVALDFIAMINGLVRKKATPCQVDALVFTDEDATIPAGSEAVRTRGNLAFTLDEDVSISRTSCERLLVLDDGSLKGTEYVFHFTFGDVTLNNTSQGTSNMEALKALVISAGGSCEFLDGREENGLLVWHAGSSVGITGEMPDDFVVLAANTGAFTATEPGLQTCEVGELNDIPVSVSGWEKVYNIVSGIPGTNLEGDDAFRLRRQKSAQAIKNTATDPSIAAHLLAEVNGVTAAVVVSNRTMSPDGDGRPGKSFETIVAGGSDLDVAQNIWENLPSGMQCWGNTSVEIIDENGDGQIVSFSRPVAKYLWVKISYKLYDEEQFPGEESLKASLVDWAAGEYGMGKDVIPDRIYSAIYPPYIRGVGQATIQVAVTDASTDTPSYVTTPIPITKYQYATLAQARITLTQTT